MSGTTITSANNPFTVSSSATISTATNNGITANYAANFNPDLVNLGEIVADSAYNDGVYLRADTTLSGAPYGAVVTNGATNNSTALIHGFGYGIDIESGSGNSSAKSVVSISNFGTIENSVNSSQGFNAAVVLGFRTTGVVNNESTGVIIGNTGFGVYDKSVGGAPDVINNAGTIDSQVGVASVWINQDDGGTGTIINTGVLQHGVGLFNVNQGTLVNAGTIGQLGGKESGENLSAQDNQVGVLDLLPGQSLDGGVASFGAGSTLELSGSVGQVGVLANPGSYIGFTSLNVGPGADWTVNGSITGISNITNEGTLTFTGNQGLGQVNMGGNGANTVFDFTGTTTGTELTNFGTTDRIIPTFGALALGDGVSLGYANGTLSVTETNAAGGSIASENITVAVTTGDTPSFTPLYGPNGVTIELASSPAATNFTFTGASNTSFENPANFLGGFAPGDNISPTEFVTIASGTAIASNGALVDNGTILVGSAFIVSSSITGTGTLGIAAGVSATLAGGASLSSSIYDSGTLTVGGTFNSNVVVAQGSAAIIDLTQSTVHGFDSGFNNNTPVPAEFAPTDVANFGLGDSIVVGPGLLAPLPTGDHYVLANYESSFQNFDVGISNAQGTVLSDAVIQIAGTNLNNMTVLAGPGGAILTELPPNDIYSFTGVGTSSSFEDPSNYPTTGAPGNSIGSGITVAISGGTAVVSNGNSLADNGLISVTGTGVGFSDPTPLTGTGTLAIGPGASATLAGGTSLGAIDNSGTLVSTGSGGLGPVNMEGNGAGSVFDFTGTTTGTELTNFGTTDRISPAFGALPAGDGVSLSYANGTLSVTETNAAGGSIASENITVAVTSGDTPSFTPLYGPNGVTIELASSPAATNFIFNGTGGNTSFENPANFVGGFAPGNNISPSENVTIASGTASIASGALVDNGAIFDKGQFIDTGAVSGSGGLDVLSGASATLSGGGTLGGIADSSTLNLAGTFAAPVALYGGAVTLSGNFADSGSIAGSGTLTVDTGVTATLAPGSSFTAVNDYGTLNLQGSLTAPINLEGDNAHSVADFIGSDITGGTLNTPLINFGQTDQIILGGTNFHLDSPGDTLGYTYNTNTDQLVVTDSTSGTVVTLNVGLAPGDLPASISLSTAGGVLDILIPCYASGTHILTPEGEVLVEDIAVGDTVITVRQGGPTTRKVVWTGQRSIDIPRHPEPELVRPVRILAGAFGPGLPERDLRLSPHHAVYADGCLFEALSLINGVTILQEPNTRHVTYHHIELTSHDVMLAEGLPAESFLDTGNRDMFEGAPAMRLHADFRSPADAQFCVKMVREGAELDSLRDRLNARAEALRPAA